MGRPVVLFLSRQSFYGQIASASVRKGVIGLSVSARRRTFGPTSLPGLSPLTRLGGTKPLAVYFQAWRPGNKAGSTAFERGYSRMKLNVSFNARRSTAWFLANVLATAPLISGLCCASPVETKGAGVTTVKLLPAVDFGAQPLLQILQKRHTSREYAPKAIDRQTLSNLLWAANGVNRADGGRTVPSAHNWQYIDIYVTDSTGLYLFDAKNQDLRLIKPGDMRAKTGLQSFAAVAPVSLVFVNDGRKFPKDTSDEDKLLFGAATAGAIAQNIYLFVAANNMATGVRADIDRGALHAAMGLAPEQRILLAQSAGYPAPAGVKAMLKSLFSGN